MDILQQLSKLPDILTPYIRMREKSLQKKMAGVYIPSNTAADNRVAIRLKE